MAFQCKGNQERQSNKRFRNQKTEERKFPF